MGHQYGTILYKHDFKVSKQSSEKLDFGRRSEKEVKRIFPEILEEIQGFADACHASYEQLVASILSVGCFDLPDFACSVFAIFNGSDVVFGRNYDFYYRFKEYAESYLTCPKDGYWSVGHSDIFVGREDGVNEKGLAVAMTGVIGTVRPGINFPLAIRCILDKCACVEEGVKILTNTHLSTLSNYLLADKDGSIAVVEVSPEKVRVRSPEDGSRFLVSTNHFLHPEMLDIENRKERCWDSVSRYTTIYNTLKQHNGKIDVKTAQKILSNHSGYVCSHQKNIKLGTLWSVIAILKKLQIFRAEGHPCRAEYRLDKRLNKALDKRQKPKSR